MLVPAIPIPAKKKAMLFKHIIRPALFSISADDPEKAHEWVMARLTFASRHVTLLKILEAAYAYRQPALERECFGLHFPNPLGLAGGFDKNGIALPALAALGFGFIEAGVATHYAQAGNDRPRIFRFPSDNALINRMGFPNHGADAIAEHLSRSQKPTIPIGWQLGKSKVTPLEEAEEDYVYTLRKLYPFGDFFTINVSSPNTPGLRQLQEKEPLSRLAHAIVMESSRLAEQHHCQQARPILVKISPDLTEGQLDDVIEVCLSQNIRGIIATNTTISREGLRAQTTEAGGLSGKPLLPRALEVVRYLARSLGGKLPIIAVGGIFGPEDATRMFDAGASLIEIYTSFIYEGPGIIKRINRTIARVEPG